MNECVIMEIIKQRFEQNGYVILTGALPENECKELTEYMFKLFEEGKLEKDSQCPLSDSVYGDAVFDNLLAKFAEPIGNMIGRKLLPTYTYARIYRTGEVLKKHKDRPSCEISATMTLGFKGKSVWPIFFDEEKEHYVDLNIGEMAVYQGCEILHWRPKFKGEWQVQVFFHYVDANGPYKHHVWDKRVSNTENTKTQVKNAQVRYKSAILPVPDKDTYFPGYTCINNNFHPEFMFTEKECDKIISLKDTLYEVSASIGGSENNSRIVKKIRSAQIYGIAIAEENYWIFNKIANIVSQVNNDYYDYELSGILHDLQLLEYSADEEIPGHYDWHIDSGNGEPATRKLSFTVQLSDPKDYTGCELVINNNGETVEAEKTRGTVHIFPSFCTHTVKPITSGKRYALVIWIHGSRRFR